MIETICNGYKFPRHTKYGKRKIEQIARQIKRQKSWLLEKIGDEPFYSELYYGSRCKSIDDVVIRMESANQRKLFAKGLKNAVRDVLLDCASSDYYYTFEKDWG